MAEDRRPILVPLDGSALAETALPWAVVLATRWRAPLVLARVVELRLHAAVSLAEAALAAGAYEHEEQEARAYLDRTLSTLRAAHPEVEMRGEVVCGDAAGALLELEQQINARVVALTTHGRTGLARWARGSVAETIVRHGAAPVLLVRPWDRDETAAHLDGLAHGGLRVLVPLDGSPLAQGVLPLV
ncbi:MAG TPA: universal stress protein, partial [Chloroflexota bacterium]|nr:universal stress protein [Chloroflexota bacterium]